MQVYLIGPMRGRPYCNFPLFDQARQRWEARGHTVVSPADLDRLLGNTATADGQFTGEREGGRAYMVHTLFALITCLSRCRAVALLPGWQESVGSSMEVSAAQFLGLRIYDALSYEELHPPRCPWGKLEAWAANAQHQGTERPHASWDEVWRQVAHGPNSNHNGVSHASSQVP